MGNAQVVAVVMIIQAFVLLGGDAGVVHAQPQEIRDLSRLLEQERKRQDLPAVAAVVVNGRGIIAQGLAGVRKLGNSTSIARGDRWHLGSNTKAITATMIGVLIEHGKLSWNTTIGSVFTDLSETMQPEYREVTIEMLLAHRGGIRHEWDVPGLWAKLWKREGTPVEQRRTMTEVMLAQEPVVKPGEYFYSNCGYGIAGHMAETITGKPWEQLVRDFVFEPLGMKSAGFGVPWQGVPPTDPWPHNRDGTPVTPGSLADNPPSIGPGGTVHASLEDWAEFVIDHLNGLRNRKTVLLKAATYHRLHRGQKTGQGEVAYALGWQVLERDWAKPKRTRGTGRCLHHAGSNNSWFALAWIAPERDMAVLTVTNIGGDGVFQKIDAVNWAVIQDNLNRSNR